MGVDTLSPRQRDEALQVILTWSYMQQIVYGTSKTPNNALYIVFGTGLQSYTWDAKRLF